ncbi:uncharacterized protein PAC_18262 [Phialocephala subalpina]|uniref:AIG1-type G domain-containing protein n=1 Tax=Phialocephala subalpina TaxID=576137 RepID=A0A1L7XTJ2_9HELO|nr:uncharacterized protein PAC_18262 [Phialocephala subalpina]
MAPNLLHHDRDRFVSMVLVMGNTGSGKSYFVNKLKEGATIESNSLYSCTGTCQIVEARIGLTNVAIVDCPGFNDTNRSDTEVLEEIAKVLSSQYLLSKQLHLRGILYLRDITKGRMEGSDMRTLNLFKSLVGKKAFPHIVFVTTMWGRLTDKDLEVAYARERELKDEFWKEMIWDGSRVQKFQGSKSSAEGIISQIIGSDDPIVLQIQRELIDKELELAVTEAGAILVPEVEERLDRSTSRIQRSRARLAEETNGTRQNAVLLDIKKAENERDQAKSDKKKLKEKVGAEMKKKINKDGTWQDNLRTICVVLEIGLTILADVILPVAGVSCSVM